MHSERVPPALPLSGAGLRRRWSLWIALSGLWLDTEVMEDDLCSSARVAAVSGYSDDEVSIIFWQEAAPVVAGNLLTPIGVSSGFDEDWLCKRAPGSQRVPPG
ncbi:DUF7079 family protein [Deinococcus apachensis]|uniref:DUF7079 family protein n=1 Tax=Deinococcus apachensis TaxID=309886 RepID=UPI00037B300A|nr:hypothetical protein [Deinococcus apachensis]